MKENGILNFECMWNNNNSTLNDNATLNDNDIVNVNVNEILNDNIMNVYETE